MFSRLKEDNGNQILQTGCSSEEICTQKRLLNNVRVMLNLCLTVHYIILFCAFNQDFPSD